MIREWLIRFLVALDERYLERHPNGDGPILRRINNFIDRW